MAAMFETAAEEMRQWADQCRRWARGARTRDQRSTLRSLEKLLRQAATEAEEQLDGSSLRSPARTKS